VPKPTSLPEWASSANANVTEPSLAQKQAGWSVRQKMPAQYLNWWKKLVYGWIQYLDGLTAEALTWVAKHTFSAGLATPTAPAAGNDVVNKTYADGLLTTLKASANTWSAKQTFSAGEDVTGDLSLVSGVVQKIVKTGAAKLQVGTQGAYDLELVVGGTVVAALRSATGLFECPAFPAPTITYPSLAAANWTNGPGDLGYLGYWKDRSGTVHFLGHATATTSVSLNLFTLPAGYRPSKTRLLTMLSNPNIPFVTWIVVNSSGQVSVNNMGAGYEVWLDGLSFLAEQ
jgi:hypothetical protein